MFAGMLFLGMSTYLSGIFGYEKVIILFCGVGLLAVFMATKLKLKEG